MRYKVEIKFANDTTISKVIRNIPSEMIAHCVTECAADEFEERGIEVVYAAYTPCVRLTKARKTK